MLPLLIPLVAQLAPSLIDWLFGKRAGAATAAVAQAIHTVTGTDPSTPEGITAATAIIQDKPELALQLQSALMTIKAQMQAEADREADAQRQTSMDEVHAALADTASARAQTIALSQDRSPIAYGAPIVSAIVLLAFAVMLALVLIYPVPAGSTALANVMLGTLAGMASGVVSYWVGSSAGSARKTEDLARAQDALAVSTPVPGARLPARL